MVTNVNHNLCRLLGYNYENDRYGVLRAVESFGSALPRHYLLPLNDSQCVWVLSVAMAMALAWTVKINSES